MPRRRLCLLIILVIVAPSCSGQPEYQIWESKEYGYLGFTGLKVWISTNQLGKGKAITRDVNKKYGGTYDEVTVFVYSEGDKGNLKHWPPALGLARHSFTCSNDGSIKRDF